MTDLLPWRVILSQSTLAQLHEFRGAERVAARDDLGLLCGVEVESERRKGECKWFCIDATRAKEKEIEKVMI